MTKANKFFHLVPYLLLFVFLVYTWYMNIAVYKAELIADWVALSLFILNALLYCIKFQWGIVLTGIILLLATFTVIKIFPTIHSFRLYKEINDTEIGTPPIDWRALLILMLNFFLNASILSKTFRLKKEKK